jgi:hypothetical protein
VPCIISNAQKGASATDLRGQIFGTANCTGYTPLNGRVNITDELEWTWKLHLLHNIVYCSSILLGVTEENSETSQLRFLGKYWKSQLKE